MTSLQVADGHLLDSVKNLELARYAAMVREDFDALAALLAEDLTYHHSNAHADTKASWLASLRSGQTRFRAIETGDLQVRLFGTTAIITGTLTMEVTVDGAPQRNPLRFTDVWIAHDGQWQMVAWQSTRLP